MSLVFFYITPLSLLRSALSDLLWNPPNAVNKEERVVPAAFDLADGVALDF